MTPPTKAERCARCGHFRSSHVGLGGFDPSPTTCNHLSTVLTYCGCPAPEEEP
ncbi:MAG: hypothetical protein KGI89_02990 [Euryarchaeota archaeon]|nr:hypothetical protein [Euryarchaeota archaeon]